MEQHEVGAANARPAGEKPRGGAMARAILGGDDESRLRHFYPAVLAEIEART